MEVGEKPQVKDTSPINGLTEALSTGDAVLTRINVVGPLGGSKGSIVMSLTKPDGTRILATLPDVKLSDVKFSEIKPQID